MEVCCGAVKKKKILFLCTKNSVRSQMAEGLTNHLRGDAFDACSAGVDPYLVHPYAIEVMREIGIDISTQRSKHVDELQSITVDYVVSLCDNAATTRPLFDGGGKRIHHAFDNPADAQGSEEEKKNVFRRVRDELKEFILFFSPEQ
jgi:arsenate reductase (thioredoxin)